MKSNFVLGAAAVLGLLGACGGDGDGGGMPGNDSVPAGALASAKAFSAYAGSVPVDDRAEPLSLDGVTPPTSETDEPIEAT